MDDDIPFSGPPAQEMQHTRSFPSIPSPKNGSLLLMSGMLKKPTVSGDHTAFRKMEKRLEEVGGSLQDLVTMTVFILDVRHGPKFGEIRSGYFSGGYPASAQITVAGFAHPDMMIEIQAVAVTGDE